MPEVKEETEDTPYWEWDLDHSDLMNKLECYIADAYHQDIPNQNPIKHRDPDIVNKCHYYAIEHKLLIVVHDGEGTVGDAIVLHAETLKNQDLADLVEEIIDITYEWNSDDQCFYEEP